MQKQLILYLSIFISTMPGATAAVCAPETADSLRITQIVVVGNQKTKDHVILREMKTRPGDRFDAASAEIDRKRIQNLQLFTRVEIAPMFSSDGVILLIYVAERWFIFPYPILYYNERDWKKLSYGAGLIYQNLKGLNQNVAGAFWLGYNPGMHLYFSNPWFGGDKRLYTHIKVFAERIRSKSLAYDRFDENYRGVTFSLGKRWGYSTYLSMQLGYRYLQVD